MQDITCWNCNQKGHFQNQCLNIVASKDKEVHMAVSDYDDALVCCVENTIDDHIMDSGASFHATFCKEDLERFRLRSNKDVSLVVAHGNKRGSLYMVEVPSNGINASIDGRGNTTLWHQRLGHMSEKGGSRYYVTLLDDSSRKVWVYFLKNKSEVFNTFKKWKAAVENETNLRVKYLKFDNGGEYSSREFIKYCAENWIKMLKTVPETPQQNGVAERMNRTLNERAKSMRLHAGLPKMFWEEEWQRKEVSLVHLRVFGCDSYVKVKDIARDKLDAKSMKCTFTGYGSDEMGYCFWDSKGHKNLANNSIVAEHGLSSKITQSPSGISDTSEGSKNNRSFEDIGRSVEEDFEDGASSEEGGSETPQVRRSSKDSGALVRYSPLANYLVLTKNDEPESYSEALSSKESVQWKKAINEEISSLEKNQTWSLVRLPAGKKALQSKRFLVSWERRKPHVQVEEKSTRIKASTETMKVGSSFIILMLYVDGMLVTSIDMAEIKKLKRQLSKEFKMKDLGSAKQILGMSIIRDRMKEARCQPLGEQFKLSKKQTSKTEASRRRMAKVPYASTASSAMYAMVCKRPDLAHAMGVVSRFMSNLDWSIGKLSNYGGCLDLGKSTTGYVFIVGGTTVSWMSRIQKCVAMSTTKAKYMAIAEAGKELSAIHLAKNPVFHGRTKHITIRYHYIRELVSEGTLSLKKILGEKNPAYMLTKVVTTEKLKLCAASTGLRDY
ncbi:retrovirus-related pol polyprotein from transposon TNT 1-94 [Tanacetum coccineum]|uniref:Retrovirus-related pol polyprotein from transposon TNT 1-94 n=1 Tax=Tanacetum coccineum TaxID=301880 RepID=A0ABQ5JB84_9ASTR